MRITALLAVALLSPTAPAAEPVTIPPPPVQVDAPPAEPPVFVEPPAATEWRYLFAEIGGGVANVSGTIRVPPGFAASRPGMFPIPTAKLDSPLYARVAGGFDLRFAPGRLDLAWESYSVSGTGILLGYDPNAALFLPGLEAYRTGNTAGASLPSLQIRDTVGINTDIRSRADLNAVDVMYSVPVWEPRGTDGPVLRAAVGGRYAGFYADDRATGNGYQQTASTWFAGGGPHVAGRLDLPFGPVHEGWGRGITVAVGGGALFGPARQRVREVDLFDGSTPYREATQSATRAVEFLTGELGYTATAMPAGTLSGTFGVRYTQYWGLGDLGGSQVGFAAFVGFVRLGLRF